MTPPKDIIGIVRELQTNKNGLKAAEFAKDILKHAPTIAQALLIAVEALERIAISGCPAMCDLCGRHKESSAQESLSRIRSLPDSPEK